MPVDAASVGSRSGPWRGVLDARWVMAYAAGLGHGEPCYLDTTRDGGAYAHPVMPVAPEWGLLTDPTTRLNLGVNAEEAPLGVHAAHDVQLHRPLRQGDAVAVTSEVAGVERTSAGALATIRFDGTDPSGEPLWTTWMRSLYRGVGVVGDDRPAPSPAPPPTVTEPMVERSVALDAGAAHVYTECARIWNPIHTDRSIALAAGLPGIILHGTATLAHGVSTAMGHADAHPAQVVRLGGEFRAMVALPSVITIRITGTAPVEGGEVVRFEVVNEQGRVAVRDGFVEIRT